MNYLIDACSLLSFFLGEKESDKMENILNMANNNQTKLFMSLVNYGQVCMKFDQLLDEDEAKMKKEEIKTTLNITFLNLNLEITEQAAKLKSVGGLAYPDAFALATAKYHKLKLLTKDSEFKKFEGDFEIEWL
ncbi:MAG: PIN domain-containing protein [bacterium]